MKLYFLMPGREEQDLVQRYVQQADAVAESEILEHILVPYEGGVVTQVISGTVKNSFRFDDEYQIINPSQPFANVASQTAVPIPETVENGSHCEDSDNPDYVAHTDDSGEESEVVQLRKHVRKFRKNVVHVVAF
ncbi:hypothetical protein D1007_59764 [Hordeum vulgare]|nr:hypothetical protein D1007_59764 [Hordeum vulgare]